MRKILFLTIILIFFSSSAYAEQLKFVQVTDCHFSLDGKDVGGRDIGSSAQILKSTVESINSLKDIDFVIFSGDNINVANKKDLINFCEVTKSLNKPYYITVGNHDVSKYQGLSKETYFDIVRQYDKYQKSKIPYYYFSPKKDFIVVVMDGVRQVISGPQGFYSEEDLNWLAKILNKHKDKKIIIVQHFPLIEPTENKSHRLIEPEAYLNLLANNKNVVALLSGHYHAEKVTPQDGIYHISSPALINSPYQYRIIEINYNKKNTKLELKTDLIPVGPLEQVHSS